MGLEKIRRLMYIPGIKGHSRYRGVASIPSGSAYVVVNNTLASSGYPVMTGLGLTTVASHRLLSTSVSSLVDNTGFCINVASPVGAAQDVVYTIVR